MSELSSPPITLAVLEYSYQGSDGKPFSCPCSDGGNLETDSLFRSAIDLEGEKERKIYNVANIHMVITTIILYTAKQSAKSAAMYCSSRMAWKYLQCEGLSMVSGTDSSSVLAETIYYASACGYVAYY
jgi:hypothetical protein